MPLTIAALLLGAAACTASSDTAASDVGASRPPSTAQLVSAADLATCPAAGAAHGELPALTLPCLGRGPKVSLDHLGGAPTVLNLWASWCEPCQREAPYFQSLYADAGGRLRVLGVDTEDSSRSALDFAAHAGVRFPSVVDAGGRLMRQLRAVGPPVTVFVDSEGRVRHVQRGEYTSAADLRHDVATYLGVRL